jgi:CO/xanthine dehydrogenase Mo-binding subunit
MPVIGKNILRKEGRGKLTGQAKYVDDLRFDSMIYGATVRSQIARGRVKKISFEGGIPWSEFTIVTAKDIPSKNYVALILDDQPFLVEDIVNHPEEPILLLAHADKYLLEEARRSVRIEYETQQPVFTIEDSLKKETIIWGTDNIFKSYSMNKGDVDSIWKDADLIVEGDYETGAQEQLYIENNGVIAVANKKDGVTVWGSMQCPYYVHKALTPLFGLPADKIRVIQTETGGGFGGKEEYPSMIAGHAALLAWKSGHPVKIIYDRAEDMVATTKRHPSKTKHKTAVTKDGRLLAMDICFVIDGGAYATLSSVVLSRGTIHAAGPYKCDHVRINSHAVATNSPPHGAFRGFGAPQSIFALERHLDKIASVLGISPIELRRKNFLKTGDLTATKQLLKEPMDLNKVLDLALTESRFTEKKKKYFEHNKNSPIKKGLGLVTFMHGAGFTGSGEKMLASIVAAEADLNGQVHILTSSTEIGQGTNTIFTQIAADALKLPDSQISIRQPDTAAVPNSGPTVASRTCMIVGKLVETACLQLKTLLNQAGLLKESYSPEEFKNACQTYIKKVGPLKSFNQYQQPKDVQWDDKKYEGDAYGAYAWAAYVADVEVDTVTYEVHVKDFVAVQEVGRVIHPLLAAGQIEGGVAQGVGYAIYEKVRWQDGRMINNQMTNYIMPTASDVPPVRVYFLEEPSIHGPSGAKGIGELPMDGPGPAILSAIEDATGVSFKHIPLMPEDIMGGLCKK